MSKDTYYFTHDYNARTDPKIKRLIAKWGMEGYGVFWGILEDLYNNANALPLDTESIAFDLRTREDLVHSLLYDFDLFVIEGQQFGSSSVEKRLEKRNEKSKKLSQIASEGWVKRRAEKELYAKALHLNSEVNAIKERKGKEKKEKESKEKDLGTPAKRVKIIPHIFEDSPINTVELFEQAFTGTQYEIANFPFYFETISNWAKSKNEKKADWVAAARGWMARDLKDGKFVDKNFKPQTNGINQNRTGTKRTFNFTAEQLGIHQKSDH